MRSELKVPARFTKNEIAIKDGQGAILECGAPLVLGSCHLSVTSVLCCRPAYESVQDLFILTQHDILNVVAFVLLVVVQIRSEVFIVEVFYSACQSILTLKESETYVYAVARWAWWDQSGTVQPSSHSEPHSVSGQESDPAQR